MCDGSCPTHVVCSADASSRCLPLLGLAPSPSRQVREAVSGPRRVAEGWGRQAHLPPSPSHSVRLSRLFQPPGGVPGTQPLLPNSMDPTRQQGRGLGGAACGVGSLSCLPPPPSSPTLLCRSPQHGRINAENEPSPRHGAHGARPTGNHLSVCPSPWPSVCTRLLSSFHSLSVVPPSLSSQG